MENPFEIILEKLNSIEKAIEKLSVLSKNHNDFQNTKQHKALLVCLKPPSMV